MLLLLSNSTDPKGRYLEHPRAALAELFRGVRRVLFVPFAGVTVSWDDYAERVGEAFAPLGVAVDGIHRAGDMAAAVAAAEAIAVGGGNTFHLLARLQEADLLDAIRARALAGVPYVGWSAGSVVACPTIRTTNDMPVVEPPRGLGALGLVPFQINAHFTDAHPRGFHGETRRQRLAEYVAANPGARVVGLPEGDWLEVDGPSVTLRGPHDAVLFRDDAPAAPLAPDVRVDRALASEAPPAPAASDGIFRRLSIVRRDRRS